MNIEPWKLLSVTGSAAIFAAASSFKLQAITPLWCNNEGVGSIRQSVTVPEDLARKIERGARQKRLTFSKALLEYARLGLAEEQRAKQRLRSAIRKIQAAKTDGEAEALGEELMEIVFGPQSPHAQN